MNIDLEGMDIQVFKSLDLGRFRPSILTIELHDVDKMALGEVAAISYIVSNGYRLESMNVMTFAFIDVDARNSRSPLFG